MKILLFGASGQLGEEWQAYLSTLGQTNIYFIPYTSSQLDISRPQDVKHEINEQQPDVIINCAAYTKVDAAEDNTQQARTINAEAVHNLAAVCKKNDILLVHFSTDYIFAGVKEDRDRFPRGYSEEHPADPVNIYGQTKWKGEEAITAMGGRYLIMRVSWLCGAFGSNFVKTMLRLADENNEVDVVDDQFGSPTFCHSLVRQTFKLIEQDHQGTYHYTTNGMVSWADLAEAIFELEEKDVKVNRVPSSAFSTNAKRPYFSKLNTAKIQQVEGINTENWKVGLSQLLRQINNRA